MIRYRAIGEAADRVMATLVFFVAFNVGLIALAIAGVDLANFYISVVTVEVLLLAVPIARAAWAAVHAKLDALIAATPGASDALLRAEERDEAEIRGMRP